MIGENRKDPAFIGTPEPTSGVKIVPLSRLRELLEQPHCKEAIERINRFEGRPRAFQVVLHQANSKNKSFGAFADEKNQATAEELYQRKLKRFDYEKKTDASTRNNIDLDRILPGG